MFLGIAFTFIPDKLIETLLLENIHISYGEIKFVQPAYLIALLMLGILFPFYLLVYFTSIRAYKAPSSENSQIRLDNKHAKIQYVKKDEIVTDHIIDMFPEWFDFRETLNKYFQYAVSYSIIQFGSLDQQKNEINGIEYPKDLDLCVLVIGSPSNDSIRHHNRSKKEGSEPLIDMMFCEFFYSLRSLISGDPLFHNIADGKLLAGNSDAFNVFKRCANAVVVDRAKLADTLAQNSLQVEEKIYATRNSKKKYLYSLDIYTYSCLKLQILKLKKSKKKFVFHDELVQLGKWQSLIEACPKKTRIIFSNIVLNFKCKGNMLEYEKLEDQLDIFRSALEK